MMDKLQTFEIVKGNTYIEQLYFNDNDGSPLDLTKYTNIVMSIRTGITADSTLLITGSIENGMCTISGDDDNILTINLGEFNYNGGFYFRDIKFIHSDYIVTLVQGKIYVIENIS